MVSKQEETRNRVVQYIRRTQSIRSDWKSFTVNHFRAEGVPRSTVYRIINRFQSNVPVKRLQGSGRPARLMTPVNKQRLRRTVNHTTGRSQRALGAKFGCSHQMISKTLKKMGISCYKRIKVPKYKDNKALKEAQKRCRKLYNKFKDLDFLIDDEKYFGLTGYQMSGNKQYYSSNRARTPMGVKTFAKKKFEPKVLLWLAFSPKGVTAPVIRSGRSMSVTADVYVNECLEPRLLPFIRANYPRGGYIFWPDKASAHYAGRTVTWMQDNEVHFVAKEDNPTEVPQCRPIEDFFCLLVYEKNWSAKNIAALE